MSGILSVITPAATTALTTLAAVKTDLGLTTSTDDDYLTSLILRVSGTIAGWIGRPLGVQSLVETCRQAHGSYHAFYPYPPSYGARSSLASRPLVLSCVPVVAISDVSEDGTSLTTDDYEIDSASGLLWRLSGSVRCAWAASSVVVTYDAGFVLPQDGGTRTLPIAVEEAALSLIRNNYHARYRDPQVILELTEGVGRTGWSPTLSTTALDDGIKALLAPYRSIVW